MPARHGVNVPTPTPSANSCPNGLVRYLGYVVELGGVRVYHAGDCIPYAGQAERLRALRPHLALLPINGRDFFREPEHNIVGNMDFREAARLAQRHGRRRCWCRCTGSCSRTNRGFPGDLVALRRRDMFPSLTVLVHGPRRAVHRSGRDARASTSPSG